MWLVRRHVVSAHGDTRDLVARGALRAEPWGFLPPHVFHGGLLGKVAPSLLQDGEGAWLDGTPATRALFYAAVELAGSNAVRLPLPVYSYNVGADA